MALTSKDIGLDEKFRKTVDLHESEWAKDGKKQPIFGSGASWFFSVTLPTLLTGVVMVFLIKTSLSWLIDELGYGTGLIVGMGLWAIFIWLALVPIINVLADLVDFLLQKLFRR